LHFKARGPGHNVEILCSICGKTVRRMTSDIRPGVQHPTCSPTCACLRACCGIRSGGKRGLPPPRCHLAGRIHYLSPANARLSDSRRADWISENVIFRARGYAIAEAPDRFRQVERIGREAALVDRSRSGARSASNAAISTTSCAGSPCASMRRGADFGTTRQDDDAGGGISETSTGLPQSCDRVRALGPPHGGDFRDFRVAV
jgi:hypothetical protein